MNRGEFLDIIRNGVSKASIDISSLEELVIHYPWFHTLYAVILCSLYKTQNLGFEHHLKRSALYVADREVLYHLLTGDSPVTADPATVVEKVDVVPSLTKDTTAEPEDDSAARFETASGRSREDLQNEIDTRLAEIERKVPRETILQLDEEAAAEEDETGEMPEEPLPGFDTSLLDLDYSVQDWLTATPDPGREPEKKSEAELVNSFLASNPRIGPVKELTEGTSFDLTEKAEDRSGGLISETLAMIYLNQKYYTRAIQIYEKLSLKYPEKSSYFAAQIEKIKELIS